jgi:hypothetical protein
MNAISALNQNIANTKDDNTTAQLQLQLTDATTKANTL